MKVLIRMIEKLVDWLSEKEPDEWEITGCSEAVWSDERDVVRHRLVYYMRENQRGDRSVVGYGTDWQGHTHYKLTMLAWRDKLLDYVNGEFIVPLSNSELTKIKSQKFKKDGNIVEFKPK